MKRGTFAFLLLVAVAGLYAWSASGAAADDIADRRVTKKDMPRIPHTPLSKVGESFKQARGFQAELVAGEPLVGDPVDACFDEFGRMYVAEMHGYPFSQEPTKLNPKGGGKKDAGIIRLLEDTDGDGRMDKSHVFADKISWPTSVCCYNGGVFVLAPEHLYYFKDTDGDHKADVREVVLSGFGRGNVQSVTNGLRWGLDNRITFAAGRNPKTLKHRGKPLFAVNNADLRFNPKTEQFELATGGLQYGHTSDDWGTRFVCSNSNHIQQVIYPQRYLGRNPYFASPSLIRSIATDGSSAPVYRLSPPEPWRIIRQKWRAADKGYKLIINKEGGWEFLPLDPSKKKGVVPTEYPIGFFTSATGITIYRGDAYPAEFRGNAFVGDCGGNLVHRKTVDDRQVVYRATRADKGTEFFRSRDNWFRPVNFVNAPDGTLYVLDMYRETVEHPYSIPEEIKKFLYLTSGSDRGRIYRLVSPGMKRKVVPRLGDLSSVELVKHLGSLNGWNRDTAQRLLWERQDKRAVPALVKALIQPVPQARLHALYTLAGLDALKPAHLQLVLRNDKHPRVRAHAIGLAERFLKGNERGKLLEALLPLADDASPHVRFQLAFTLGETDDPRAITGLARLARDEQNGPEVQTALLSSIGGSADRLAALLLADKQFLAKKHASSLLTQVMLIVGASPKAAPALQVLATLTEKKLPLATQQVVLSGLGRGLQRRGSSLQKLLADTETSAAVRVQVAGLFTQAVAVANNKEASLAQRGAAIRLLAFADLKLATKKIPAFLSPQVAQPLQRAAVSALGGQDSDQVAETLLAGWRTYSPQVRRDVVDGLASKPARIQMLLSAVEAGTVKRGDIERATKQLLLKHPTASLRQRAKKLLGGDVSTNRAKVVADYQDVLKLTGNSSRGQQIFKKKCSVCHRVGDVGHQVAPNLASVQNKSIADLLVAVLDPNREAQPNFNVYTVITLQGRVHNGIIATETASSLTLRRAESKEDVILRTNIDELLSTGVSLMPEGLEKELSKQDLADVLNFVKTIKPQ
jgi:putative membrane-bound dehydrogenase-like protein